MAKVLGIMSGTSLDGVDYALCDITSQHIKLRKVWSVSFPKELKKKLYKAAHAQLNSYELGQLHYDLGRFYAERAPRVKCDYIGLHGQTVYHNPEKKNPATLQIGEPSSLAAKFGVPVIHQFRNMDLTIGGQGAPLATLFHVKAFGGSKEAIAVNNLGGISNVTYIHGKKILSFDTGPSNVFIDMAVQTFSKGGKHFDAGGEMARLGIPHDGLVEKWIKSVPFISKTPPKSTGREEFNEKFFKKCLADCKKKKLNKSDVIATLTLFTAESIALNYKKFFKAPPTKVILCGGGAQNQTLKNMIAFSLSEKDIDAKVMTSAELGWPTHSIEAAAFALLAFQTMNSKPGNIPQTTGARKASRLGQIVLAP